jgi:IS605 OrfB family transposase
LITIPLPYSADDETMTILEQLRKQYSNLVRFSFNRFKENITQKQIRNKIKLLNNIDLNSWLVQCAVKDGESVYDENKENKVIFGSKKEFIRRIKGLISSDEIKNKRIRTLTVQGEETKMGNRMFKLNIINDNEIIFKVNRKTHLKLKLPSIKPNYKKLLYMLEQANDIKQGEKGLTYTIKLDSDKIHISFEEPKQKTNLIQSRYIGIDLNPHDVGISVCDGNEILEVRHFEIEENITHDKLKNEMFEISKKTEKLFKKWNCKFVFVEDLTIDSKDHEKGKDFNRKIKQWIRNPFINNLKNRISVYGGKLFKINPRYTSFIGNVIYNFSDPINASLEIGRRGYDVIILKNKKFYPEMNQVKDRWKEYLTTDITSWVKFYYKIKTLEMRYRVSLVDTKLTRVSKHISNKSKVNYFFYLF